MPPPPPWAGSGPPGRGERPILGIVAGIALVLVLLGAGALVVIFGGQEDNTSMRFEPVGSSVPPGGTTDPGFRRVDPRVVSGDGDPRLFEPVMPAPNEVADALGATKDPELVQVQPSGPGPAGVICADVSVNALASHQETWISADDQRWELQLAVFDFGTPAEAARVITSRHSPEFRSCSSETPAAQMPYSYNSDELYGEVLDHAEHTGYGTDAAAILMRAELMSECPDGTGRVALTWRQVGQYSISAKAFGCDFDLETTKPILDGMAEHLG